MRLHDTHKGREAFSKVKALLRRAQARALETLFEATEEALGAVSTEDTYLYFVGPAIRVLIIAGTRNTW
jgi:hypothetical protein